MILACIFIRTKRLKTADAKLWILVVMIFGPIAWLLWWCLHRALSHPQTPESQLSQPLLADSHASAPPLDTTQTPILKPIAPAAGAGASFAVQQHGRVVALAVCDAASRAHQLRFVQASHAPNDDEIPEEMTDQYFTMEVMRDPVMAVDGFIYERASIEAWFASGKTTSPKTGAELANLSLIPNHDLRARIQDWQKQRARV